MCLKDLEIATNLKRIIVYTMKFLHTMIRVENLENSLLFYKKVFDLNLIRYKEFPEQQYTLAFLGYGNTEEDIFLELTYNWDNRSYNLGDGFGHIAFLGNNLSDICEQAVLHGGSVKHLPGVLKTSRGDDVTFVRDPDGYLIEVIDRRM